MRFGVSLPALGFSPENAYEEVNLLNIVAIVLLRYNFRNLSPWLPSNWDLLK